MDKTQADAIAQAILQPDREAQEKIRRKRAAQERTLAGRRSVAKISLLGIVIGGTAVYFAGGRVIDGIIWGGLAGGVIGWAAVWWRGRRSAA
jgi:hypothetical protein